MFDPAIETSSQSATISHLRASKKSNQNILILFKYESNCQGASHSNGSSLNVLGIILLQTFMYVLVTSNIDVNSIKIEQAHPANVLCILVAIRKHSCAIYSDISRM